jgi:tetratricopeptide (TPR) repeat protein
LVRGDLDWIVMKCLEKDRARRYETANNVAQDIERHLNHEPVSAAAPSTVYRAQKFIRRHKAGLAVAGALVVLLAAGVVVSTWQAVRATRAERQAQTEALYHENLALLGRTNVDVDVAATLEGLAYVLQKQGKEAEVKATVREAWRVSREYRAKAAARGEADGLSRLAWLLATCDDASLRDGPRALDLAQKAATATNRKDPVILGTLAAAYAEVGKFAAAVEVQQEAIPLLWNEQQEADFACRLRGYEGARSDDSCRRQTPFEGSISAPGATLRIYCPARKGRGIPCPDHRMASPGAPVSAPTSCGQRYCGHA